MTLFAELKRRNVFRVAAAYVVLSWLLLQVGDVLFEALGVPDWAIKLVVGLLALGLLPALLFSWAYEITPEGIKKESQIDRGSSIAPHTGRKLDWVTIGLVVVAVGFALIDRFVIGRASQESEPVAEVVQPAAGTAATAERIDGRKSIAVLPFSSFSDDPENAFFASGVHEDILTHLSKVHSLRVISRSSVEQYAENRPTIAKIAAVLGVDHILEGSVRRAGERVRVSAQLIDATTDEHLWADNFDRDLDDVFAIQSEIARAIAAALKTTLSEDEERLIAERPTANIEAYDLYLRGREILRRGEYAQDKYIEAEPLFQRAVELDPGFALAWTYLAEIHGQAVWIGFGERESRTAKMKAAIDRALELAPERPEVQAILGEYYYRIEKDFRRAADQFERAHARLPGNAEILSRLGLSYRRLGRWDDSVARFEQAIELDPGSKEWVANLADTLLIMQQWDRTIALVDPLLDEYPDASGLAAIKGWALLSGYGRIDAAREAIAGRPASTDYHYVWLTVQLPWLARDYPAALAAFERPKVKAFYEAGSPAWRDLRLSLIHERMGDPDRARGDLERARAWAETQIDSRPDDYWPRGVLALSQADLGEPEQARASAERSLESVAKLDDHMDMPGIRWMRAGVLARIGEVEAAVDELSQLIDRPGGVSRWDLALDPFWDPLRDNPRFAELSRVEVELGTD